MAGVGNYDVQYTLILRDQMTKTLAKVGTAAKGFNGYIEGAEKNMMSMFSKGNIATAAMGGAFYLMGKGIKNAMDFEQTQISFEVMLGSAEKAQKMLSEIEGFAAATPFETSDLIDSSKLLLNFGVSQKKIMPLMKQLGDITAGDAVKLHSMSLAFGQMSSTGRLMGQDLNQMINAGFNPLEYIARRTGKSMADLKAEMAAGRISVEMVEQAFADATGEGGRFNGMMEKQSKTLKGQWSTTMDMVNVQLRNWGTNYIPFLSDGVGAVNNLIEGDLSGSFKSFQKVLLDVGNTGMAPFAGKLDRLTNSAKYAAPTYQTLHEKMQMIAGSSLDQLNQGLTHHTELIESAASLTESTLTAALDRAQKMYGLTSDQIDTFMTKVTAFKKMTGDKSNPLGITDRTTSDLEASIKEFKDLQEGLTGNKDDMKKRQSYQKEIAKLEKEIGRREGSTKGAGAKSLGSEGTTVSSRAPQYYTITIDQLVGTINTKKEVFNESDFETKRKVTEVLVGALNDTQLIAANK